MTSSSCSLSITSSDLPEVDSLDLLDSTWPTSSAGCKTVEGNLVSGVGLVTEDLDAYCSDARYPICSSGYADRPEIPRLISSEHLSKGSSTVYRNWHLYWQYSSQSD